MKGSKWQWLSFWGILLLGILMVLFGVNYYFKIQKQKLIEAKKEELSSISFLKIRQISDWYVDELLDASTIIDNISFIRLIEEWLAEDNAQNRKQLSVELNQLVREHGYYSVTVLSRMYENVVSSDIASPVIENHTLSVAEKVIEGGEPLISNMFLSADDSLVFMDFIVPVKSDFGGHRAAVIFRHDLEKFLFPLVDIWPVQSRTAETVLVRRDGDDVLFLSDMNHNQNAALRFRLPLSIKNVVSVNAVLGGSGCVNGIDYRGEEVLAYVDSIPHTPWYLIAKIDKHELYDGFFFRSASPIVFSALGTLVLLILFYVFYLQKQKNFFQRLYTAEQEFKTILYSIGDAVITTDNRGVVKTLNPLAEKLTGWKEEEALDKDIEEIFVIINEENLERVESPVKKVMACGVVVGLANHTLLISRQGDQIPISDSGAPIFDETGNITGVVIVFRDQTEERKQQRKTFEIQRKLSTLMSNLPGIAYRCKNDALWTMEFVSKGCEHLTGYADWELEDNQLIAYEEIILPDDRKYVQDTVRVALENHTSFQLEYRIITKNKELKWVWEQGVGVCNDDGQVIAIEGFIADISERINAEEALLMSEKLFQTLARNASVGIFRTNATGMTTYVNPEWCRLSGLGSDKALGEGWFNSIHPLDRQMVVDGWRKASSEFLTSEAEYRFVHPDGKIVWVKGKAVPETDDSGKITGYIGTIDDITEIKNSSEAIHKANALLRTIIDNIPDAIYMKDLQGRKLIGNKADLLNCGVSTEEELIGKTDFEIFKPDVATSFWADDQMVLTTGQSVLQRDELLVNALGEEKWLQTSKIPLLDKDDQVIGLVGIGRDVTMRKKQEEEMLKLNTVVTQSPVSILIADPNGVIEYVNPKFLEVTGYLAEDIVGQNTRILKSGAQSEEFYNSLWRTILSGNDWKGEILNKKKDGELFWENVMISPIKDDSGSIAFFIELKEDITEKRQMMQELIEAKEKAEESDKLKSSFLANMSHEIRTPLNSILGFSSFLTDEEGLSKKEKQEYSSIINKSADSLLQIINDIIDISSLETGQLKTYIVPVEVGHILRALLLVFSQKLNEMNKSHVILDMVLDCEVSVMADENRLIQIITNLANNAMKFTEKGTIRFGVEKVEQDEVVFIVADTGIGIAPDMHQSVFERFRQVENAKTRIFGGNGLGLTIVKNLVERMNGHIWLESEVGKGSIFRFTLPKVK